MAYASGENATATSASGKRAGVPYVEKSDAKVAAAMVANVWTDYAEGIGSGKTVSFDGLGQLHIDSEKGQLVVEKVSDKLNYLVCVCAPREGDARAPHGIKSLTELRSALAECFADDTDAQ